MSTLGPYDYWAIEYGYREFAPEQENAGLARIAERSTEPTLAFMADDTLYFSGLDPLANTFDLGADPLAYADRQLKLARELWQLTESRSLQPDEIVCAAAAQFLARAVRGAAERDLRGQVHRRAHAPVRPRRQRPGAARAGLRRTSSARR